jgi:hypothetical protein
MEVVAFLTSGLPALVVNKKKFYNKAELRTWFSSSAGKVSTKQETKQHQKERSTFSRKKREKRIKSLNSDFHS